MLVPEGVQRPAMFTILALKGISAVISFPTSTILLTNSSPSLRLLGTLNGVAVTVAALGRAIGPSVGGPSSTFLKAVLINML